jgi:transposase
MTTETTSLPTKGKSESLPKAKRRVFSAKYKEKILKEADGCSARGEMGALLRREGLYSSHLAQWREQARSGQLEPKKRGPTPKQPDPRDKVIAELRRENARLARRAKRAEVLVEVQKKVSKLLGIVLATPEEEEKT